MATVAWARGAVVRAQTVSADNRIVQTKTELRYNAVRRAVDHSTLSVLRSCYANIGATSMEAGCLGAASKNSVMTALAVLMRDAARTSSSPADALREGHWVKLICGASFEDTAEVRNLSLVYTLAGVDCIDCAADPAIVNAVLEGVSTARDVASRWSGLCITKPWIMVSINDDEDPHFRKAEFDPKLCPTDCPRPCERVCPVSAIDFNQQVGIKEDRCYGCGRCLSVCPLGLIRARTYLRGLETVGELLRSNEVDAVEIHTGAGHLDAFEKLWTSLGGAMERLKLVAVSVPNLRESMIPILVAMYGIMKPSLRSFNLWQLDGRPMSGDIGAGATRAAVALASRVAAASDRPPGFLQLAGGTNGYTLEALKRVGLMTNNQHGEAAVGGVAYGGHARKIVRPYLVEMEESEKKRLEQHPSSEMVGLELESCPSLLLKALEKAIALVQPSKRLKKGLEL